MKNFALILIAVFIQLGLFSQVRGSGQITKEERMVGTFSAVKIGQAQEVVLMNGDQYSVVIETNENLHERISIVIQNNTLWFEYKDVKYYDELKLYITAPDYKSLMISGASTVYSSDTLRGRDLKLSVSGASDADLQINYDLVQTRLSGASDLTLEGKANTHNAETSGASNLDAKALMTETTVLGASGASVCKIEASDNLTYKLSGASSVQYVNKPKTLVIKNQNASENVVILNDSVHSRHIYYYSDTTKVNLGAFDVEVIDGDTTKISVGAHTIIVDDDGNVKYERNKKRKFNGHWGGVELGINGYVTPDFNTNWGEENDYLRLRYEKSMQVNLNIYEQNIPLNKDRNMGLVTGLGLAWNNYRYSPPSFLSPDSSTLKGYYMVSENGTYLSVRKTKLTAMYITVPLMYEIQTKNPRKMKRFHFGLGAQMSIRVSSHTKVYFNQANQPYYLQYPGTNERLPYEYRTPNTTQRNIIKNSNSFHLQPFKFDAMVRIGYGIINLWGHFGLNTMYKRNEGPLLYTWAAGITLVGW